MGMRPGCPLQDKTQGLPAQHARVHVTMAAVAVVAAGELDEHTERVLQIATCMAMAGFGEAVARMVRMARAFYWDKVLWAVHKDHKGARRRTYLMHAAWTGNLARVGFLLARRSAVDEGNKWGTTALMCASEAGHVETARCLWSKVPM